MADQVFPYHLAGFAMGALAAGYSISSLKRCLTRPVISIEETIVDPNLLLPIQTRKRKRDPDATSLPSTKRRVPDAINTSLSANTSNSSDDLNTSSPIKSVKVASNPEQASIKVTISNLSSRPAHFVETNSHYGVKISFCERKYHTNYLDSHDARSRRHKKSRLSSGTSTTENKANEEDYHSDRTMIGDDFNHHDDGSDDSDEQSEEGSSSADRDEEDDFDDLIGEGSDLETQEGEDDDFADRYQGTRTSRPP